MKTKKIEELESLLKPHQVEALKEVVRRGGFDYGGAPVGRDGTDTMEGPFYKTRINKSKEWSGILSGISRTIEKANTDLLAFVIRQEDGFNGTSGIMFNELHLPVKDLELWARK